MRNSDIICIGVQKSGTTWFHHNMAARPDIWVPPFKEVHFFDYKFVPEYRKWITSHIEAGVERAVLKYIKDHTHPDQLYLDYLRKILTKPMFNGSWYKHIFSRAPKNTLGLDVTPDYFAIPEEGIQFASRFSKHAKFLLFVREPVDRAISQVKMKLRRRGIRPKNEQEWLVAIRDPLVLRRSHYTSIIPLWEKAIPSNRLLILSYSLLTENPDSFMKQVEDYLGLDPYQYPKLAQRIHQGSSLKLPDYAVAELKQQLAEQSHFFHQRFRL